MLPLQLFVKGNPSCTGYPYLFYMKTLPTLALLLGIVILAAWYPQDDYSLRYSKWKKQYAQQQITALKNGGVLLVRLQTRTKSIDLYRNNGQHNVANRIEDEQYQENKAIVSAFNQLFNFAPVYFFYADNTDKVQAGNTTGIFLNSKLVATDSINPKLDFFMVAEFGPLEGETKVIPGDTLVALPDYVPGDLLERALVVRDHNFMQMRSPFPYFVRAAAKNKSGKQVNRLNEQLHSYFKNATKEPQ